MFLLSLNGIQGDKEWIGLGGGGLSIGLGTMRKGWVRHRGKARSDLSRTVNRSGEGRIDSRRIVERLDLS